MHSIAADFGVHRRTLDKLLKHWGWKLRKYRPPRDLPPALRLHVEADRAIESEMEADLGQTKLPPKETGGRSAAELSVAERLERAVEKELATVEITRAQLGSLSQRSADAERTARTLQTLTETLFKVRRLRAPEPQFTSCDDYDDMPGDIDEFRRTLALRIETFVRSRTDGFVSEPGESCSADSPP
jgi:hypothetical protein